MKRNYLYTLYLLVALVLVITLLVINVLPFKTLMIVVSFILGYYVILLVLMRFKIKLKLLTLLLIGVYIFVEVQIVTIGKNLLALNKQNSFVEVATITNKEASIKKVGILNDYHQDYVVEYLKEYRYEYIVYQDVLTLFQDLDKQKLDAVVATSNITSLLEEPKEYVYQNPKNYKIVKSGGNTSIDLTKDTFHIYVSGNDHYGRLLSNARSDVNMVVTVNPLKREVLMTSIPRDYYVPLACKEGAMDKLTHSGIYGIDCTIATVEQVLDIEMDYYARVDFSTLEHIVDTIGGIQIYSDIAFTSYPDKVKFEQGLQTVDGKKALAFARERKAYVDGDGMRVVNQQAVLRAIIEKLRNPLVFFQFNRILDIVSLEMDTNMPTSKMTQAIKLGFSSMLDKWHIDTQSLYGSDARGKTYSIGNQEVYIMKPDKTSIEQAKMKIKEISR
ncbi:MAG: LCP family protein [Erysipelotrichaceae bacterium]|nr:LCP family protein [Erysipelotrichaceae bacterium]